MRRKDDVAGVWVNTSSMVFSAVPSYYAVASNRPIEEIAGPLVLERHAIGFAHVNMTPAPGYRWSQREYELAAFKAALIRVKQKQGLYLVKARDGVTFTGRSLFRSTIALPANVPVGPLVARTYLFRDGQVLSAQINRVTLERAGLERVLHTLRVPLSVQLRRVRRHPRRAGGAGGVGLLPPRDDVIGARALFRGSVLFEEARGDRIKPLLPEHPHAQAVVAEQRLERLGRAR